MVTPNGVRVETRVVTPSGVRVETRVVTPNEVRVETRVVMPVLVQPAAQIGVQSVARMGFQFFPPQPHAADYPRFLAALAHVSLHPQAPPVAQRAQDDPPISSQDESQHPTAALFQP